MRFCLRFFSFPCLPSCSSSSFFLSASSSWWFSSSAFCSYASGLPSYCFSTSSAVSSFVLSACFLLPGSCYSSFCFFRIPLSICCLFGSLPLVCGAGCFFFCSVCSSSSTSSRSCLSAVRSLDLRFSFCSCGSYCFSFGSGCCSRVGLCVLLHLLLLLGIILSFPLLLRLPPLLLWFLRFRGLHLFFWGFLLLLLNPLPFLRLCLPLICFPILMIVFRMKILRLLILLWLLPLLTLFGQNIAV